MAGKKYTVRVGIEEFPPAAQERSNRKWNAALAFAHQKEETFCMCVRGHPIKLVVRHYGRNTPNSFYGVARWKGTGLDHNDQCIHFGEEHESDDDGESRPAFTEREDGSIRVHLARPLSMQSSPSSLSESGSTSSTNTSQARASDISVLLRIWRAANLNVFSGTGTTWFLGSLRALHTARTMVINRSGKTLADSMLIGANDKCKSALEHNDVVLKQCEKQPQRLFVLGRIRYLSPDQLAKPQFLLPLMEWAGLPKILTTANQYKHALSGRPFLKNILADKSGYVVALCCIEPSDTGWWKCVSIVLTPVTPNLIPVESSYELKMEKYLVDNQRKFLKPIHVNELAGSDQRPDFILLDTRPRTMIEVWGMQTPEYLSQKEIRLQKYKERGDPVLSWAADQNDPLPLLPPKQ